MQGGEVVVGTPTTPRPPKYPGLIPDPQIAGPFLHYHTAFCAKAIAN